MNSSVYLVGMTVFAYFQYTGKYARINARPKYLIHIQGLVLLYNISQSSMADVLDPLNIYWGCDLNIIYSFLLTPVVCLHVTAQGLWVYSLTLKAFLVR